MVGDVHILIPTNILIFPRLHCSMVFIYTLQNELIIFARMNAEKYYKIGTPRCFGIGL